jgi:hypothetical protein
VLKRELKAMNGAKPAKARRPRAARR